MSRPPMTESSQKRKCREISNPEADLQLIAPPANRELFKSRFAKARKMNAQAKLPGRLQQLRLPEDRDAGPVNFSRWFGGVALVFPDQVGF